MQGETAFWLVDKATLEAQKIAGIAPDASGSRSAWSPDGRRLAIANQAGGGDAGPVVSLVEPARGSVAQALPLPAGSATGTPWLEWLTIDRLYLYHSETDAVDVYDRELDTLLFFADGAWAQTRKAPELSSSQGVSMVSLPDGELLGFWEFSESGARVYPYPVLSPDGQAAVVVADLVGVFFMRLAGP